MAKTVQLSELRTNAKRIADMENGSFVTDAEWLILINKAKDWLYGILAQHGLNQNEVEQSITGDGTTTDTALPAAYYGTLRVEEVLNSSGHRRDIRRIMSRDINKHRRSYGRTTGYYIVNDSIRLIPAPPTGDDIRHVYIPNSTDLVNDTDTIDGVNGWELLVELQAAKMALIKEESDISAVNQEIAIMLDRIYKEREQMELTNPRYIVDTEHGELLSGDYIWNDPANWRFR